MMNSYLLCLLVDLTSPIGPVVRLAPKQYSFSDPSVLKQIYGIGKGVSKVRANGENLEEYLVLELLISQHANNFCA